MDIEGERKSQRRKERERQDGDIAKNEEKGEIVLPCRWGGMKERERERRRTKDSRGNEGGQRK